MVPIIKVQQMKKRLSVSTAKRKGESKHKQWESHGPGQLWVLSQPLDMWGFYILAAQGCPLYPCFLSQRLILCFAQLVACIKWAFSLRPIQPTFDASPHSPLPPQTYILHIPGLLPWSYPQPFAHSIPSSSNPSPFFTLFSCLPVYIYVLQDTAQMPAPLSLPQSLTAFSFIRIPYSFVCVLMSFYSYL